MSSKKNKFSKKDIEYMSLALNLAKARHGLTGLNPSVGCVIVKDDQIISIGQTGYKGRPHAEYNAIKNSIESLNNTKMYITLEPCSHYGQTPPCTKEIIKNKIKEVIYSIDDVDNKVRGKSFNILRIKKIKVKKGLLVKKINDFYTPYFINRKKKIPFVTGKIAVSKNDIIYSKSKKRITDIHSDSFSHFLRYKNDSLLISVKTLNKDNPKLNCRLSGLNKFSPKRIILDKNLEMKTNSYIFKTATKSNTIVFYNNVDRKKFLKFKKKGINLIKSNLINNKHFNLKLILKKIYTLGCRNLLIEGGNDLSKNFLKDKLFNKFYLFRSPKNLSKLVDHKEFNCFKYLSQNYKNKNKINITLGKDSITLYKK
jgi:diaminohydroxyphosphoribosylaminopyrimidine deaminase / 5-amino-6-(5-phosphoribosylamino)uracil reductase